MRSLLHIECYQPKLGWLRALQKMSKSSATLMEKITGCFNDLVVSSSDHQGLGSLPLIFKNPSTNLSFATFAILSSF